jgi:hypothetical protein
MKPQGIDDPYSDIIADKIEESLMRLVLMANG